MNNQVNIDNKPVIDFTHDEALKKLFVEYKSADKKRYTDFFLSSLSSSVCNSGLYVYAAMKTFPEHSFVVRENERQDRLTPCAICSSYHKNISNGEKYDLYYFVAGLNADDVYKRLYIMHRINRLEHIPYTTEQDFNILKEIVLRLKNAEPNAKIRDIHKQLKQSEFYKPSLLPSATLALHEKKLHSTQKSRQTCRLR